MPIKPIYADKIIAGEKKFEFRRTKINEGLSYIIIYSSSPIKKIIAIGTVNKVAEASVGKTWILTRHLAGLAKHQFLTYFEGKKTAWSIELQDVLPLQHQLTVSTVARSFHIPQSFRYVDIDFLIRVLEKGFS